jgi:hypothetical protein
VEKVRPGETVKFKAAIERKADSARAILRLAVKVMLTWNSVHSVNLTKYAAFFEKVLKTPLLKVMMEELLAGKAA